MALTKVATTYSEEGYAFCTWPLEDYTELVLWWPIDLYVVFTFFMATDYFLMKPLGCISWSHSWTLSLEAPLFKSLVLSCSSLSDWAGPDTGLCP